MTTGPRPLGTWSGSQARNHSASHGLLLAGQRYRVICDFVDFDGDPHPAGEQWTFLGAAHQPHDDGVSFFVSLDGRQEWHIRMQRRPEEQDPVLDALTDHLCRDEGDAPVDGSGPSGPPMAR